MVRFEDILFWILIASIIAVAIWMLSGSPPLENGLLMIMMFVATSEILLWKTLFKIDKKSAVRFAKIDKKTSIGFVKVKTEIEKLGNNINNKLINIENLIKK